MGDGMDGAKNKKSVFALFFSAVVFDNAALFCYNIPAPFCGHPFGARRRRAESACPDVVRYLQRT